MPFLSIENPATLVFALKNENFYISILVVHARCVAHAVLESAVTCHAVGNFTRVLTMVSYAVMGRYIHTVMLNGEVERCVPCSS